MDRFAHLRTYALVTVLSVLVWAFAESEGLSARSIGAEVRIEGTATPAGGLVATVPDGQGWSGRVQIELRGSASGIEAIEPFLQRTLRLTPGLDSFAPVAGENIIDLRSAIRDLPELRGAGITIAACEPPNLRVIVQEIATRTIPVRVDVGDSQTDGQPLARPSTVTIALPKPILDALPLDTPALAALDPGALARLVPGRGETLNGVPLRLGAPLPPDTYIRFTPAVVDVALALRSRTSTITLPSVPVHVRLAPAELGRWRIDIPDSDRFLTDVRITGPDDLVDQVRREEIKITAVVPLSFEELERGITSKEAIFSDLPGPLKFDADRRLVRLTISRAGPALPITPAR